MRITFKMSLDFSRKEKYTESDDIMIDERMGAHIEHAGYHPVGFSANPVSMPDWEAKR